MSQKITISMDVYELRMVARACLFTANMTQSESVKHKLNDLAESITTEVWKCEANGQDSEKNT